MTRYWARFDDDGNIRTVESYSHDLDVVGAIEITEADFDGYLETLPEPEALPSLQAEIEALWKAIDEIKKISTP